MNKILTVTYLVALLINLGDGSLAATADLERSIWFNAKHELVVNLDDYGSEGKIGLSGDARDNHLIPFTESTKALASQTIGFPGKGTATPSDRWLKGNQRDFFPLFADVVDWHYDIRVGPALPVVPINEQWIITYTQRPKKGNLVSKYGGTTFRRLMLANGASPKPGVVYHLRFRTRKTSDLKNFGTQVSVQVLQDDLDYFGKRTPTNRMNDTVWYSMGGADVEQVQFVEQATAPPDLRNYRAKDGQLITSLFEDVGTEFDRWRVNKARNQLEFHHRTIGDGSRYVYHPGYDTTNGEVPRVEDEYIMCLKGLGRVALSQYVDGKLSMTWSLVSARKVP
jgi:hypothetical protein